MKAVLRGIMMRIEDAPVPFGGLLAWFLAVISVREAIEQVLFGRAFGLYTYYHHTLFFLVTLAAGILALALWTRTDFVRTARIVAAGYILVILPPLIDRFLFHRAGGYEYAMPADFLRRAATFYWGAPGAGKGIFIEGVLVVAMALAYAWLKTRSDHRRDRGLRGPSLLVGDRALEQRLRPRDRPDGEGQARARRRAGRA
jgi:hypothetical protein